MPILKLFSMLWFRSHLTYRWHIQASTQIHMKVMAAAVALAGVSEVNLSCPRSLLMLQGFDRGLSPKPTRVFTKHELQSPQTRHCNACGLSAPCPWRQDHFAAQGKALGVPQSFERLSAFKQQHPGSFFPYTHVHLSTNRRYLQGITSISILHAVTHYFIFSLKIDTRNEYLPNPAVPVRQNFKHAPA